ncbi:hypothetical protein BTA51_13190 [Hahella sp. CCB-MM4]|uniref:PilZ domain-containing protein n=1 Tax=Hahella sp. (strain CCB-MM4) TaxID=1926491 RepID=UPI000BDB23CA|nr:PilZ domain-containing protein [Hahella sp. CCB-MM4]OZG72910.1 hypothetical protein BTA51_13190 [Hahella sp. CCB-MM4]
MRDCIFQRHFERRIKTRHKAPFLTVTANFVGLFSRSRQPLKVKCIDFNRYGMAILSDQRLKPGDKLEFSFRGRYITEDGIQGTVTSVAELQAPCQSSHPRQISAESLSGYRYGIRFTYCQSPKEYSRDVDNAMSRIEGLFGQISQQIQPQAS